MAVEKNVHIAIREIVAAGLAASAHDLSDGGFAVALAEASFDGIGAVVTLPSSSLRPELLLFHEAPSRILLSTNSPEEISKIADNHGVPVSVIGKTVKGQVVIEGLLNAAIEELQQPWASALENALHV